MLKTEPLEQIVKLVLNSAYLKNERPLSLLVVARAEAGKTTTLQEFVANKNKGIAYKTDFTAFGLIRDVLPLVNTKKIHHIICPDLLKPLSRKLSTVRDLISFLNGLIEDGKIDISSFVSPQKIASEKLMFDNLECGLIGGITKDELLKHKQDWISKGFLSRTIPFSYDYSQGDVIRILNSIMKEEYHNKKTIELKNYQTKQDIKLDLKLAEQLLPLTLKLAEKLNLIGFRFQKQLQVLMKSNALIRKDTVTKQMDLDVILDLSKWINFDFNPL
jgi:hypothetical protein